MNINNYIRECIETNKFTKTQKLLKYMANREI